MIRAGDKVAVRFAGWDGVDRGVIVDATDDLKNVTIKTEAGGLMNGTVEKIELEQSQLGSIGELVNFWGCNRERFFEIYRQPYRQLVHRPKPHAWRVGILR